MSRLEALIKKGMKKIKQPKVLISIFLAGIMIFSVLGFMMSYKTDSGSTKLEYNNYEFEQLYDGLKLKINDQEILMNYFPEQLESITIDPAASTVLQTSQVIAIVYNPDSEYKEYLAEQQFELEEKLTKIDKYVIPGITNNTEVEHMVQLDCANATQDVPVILLKEKNETNISLKNNCVIADISTINEAYQVGDLLFYKMAGVME